MRRVVLPRQNARDLVDVPAHVQQALELVFASRIDDAVAAVIPTLRDVVLHPPSTSPTPP
jgi:ATP-dependent Lon protease